MQTFTKRFASALVMMSFFMASVTAQSQANLQEAGTPSVASKATRTYSAQSSSQVDALLLSTLSDFSDFVITNLASPTDTLLWEFTTDPQLTGTFTGQVVASETTADGFALLNFDRFTGGDTSLPPVTNELTSPSYDVTSLDPGLAYQLSFYAATRFCCVGPIGHTVSVSTDGGATFTTPINLDPTIAVNAPVDGIFTIPLPAGVENSTEFQVRFTYQGAFYYLAIDDISITAVPAIEPQVNDFFSFAPNFATPAMFAEETPISFVADIQSNGFETNDFQLAITIADAATNAVVYTDTLLYADIARDSVAENQVFPIAPPLPTAVGDYVGTYEIFTDRIAEDADTTNNTQSFTFSVTEDLFSKGPPLTTIDCCADDSDFSSGNIYYTPSVDLAGGDSLFIRDISFAFDAQNIEGDDSAILEVKTYGFRGDLNLDSAPNFGDVDDDDAELVELSVLFFEIDTTSLSAPSNTIITMSPDEDGNPIFVDTDEFVGFAVSVDYFASTDGGTNVDNDFNIFGDNLGYGAVELAADSTNNSRLNSFLIVPDRGIDVFAYFGGLVAFTDATVMIGSEVVSVGDILLETAQFDVRPNPATTEFAIDFDFNTSVNAQFEIINAVGQTVSVFNRDGLTSGAITVPTQGMNNGLYYVKVRTQDGQTATRKLMVNR